MTPAAQARLVILERRMADLRHLGVIQAQHVRALMTMAIGEAWAEAQAAMGHQPQEPFAGPGEEPTPEQEGR